MAKIDEIVKHLQLKGINIPKKIKTEAGYFYPQNYLKAVFLKLMEEAHQAGQINAGCNEPSYYNTKVDCKNILSR